MDFRVRAADPRDRDAIRNVCLTAFADEEREMVTTLATNLLSARSEPETFTLVAELDGSIIGCIAFSPVALNDGGDGFGYILAPLGVSPGFQNQHVGSKLVTSGISRASLSEAKVILVYGDPDYYGRFGFSAVSAEQFEPPYELQYPFGWQARILEGVLLGDETFSVSCVECLRDPRLW